MIQLWSSDIIPVFLAITSRSSLSVWTPPEWIIPQSSQHFREFCLWQTLLLPSLLLCLFWGCPYFRPDLAAVLVFLLTEHTCHFNLIFLFILTFIRSSLYRLYMTSWFQLHFAQKSLQLHCISGLTAFIFFIYFSPLFTSWLSFLSTPLRIPWRLVVRRPCGFFSVMPLFSPPPPAL